MNEKENVSSRMWWTMLLDEGEKERHFAMIGGA